MAKKVVSVALHKKKKPINKHSNKRRKLNTALKNIFNYMKSDTYMFAPSLYPQSYPTSAPASFCELSLEPIKKKENKLVHDINNYLKCDCYMYAPLLVDSAFDDAILQIGDGCRENKKPVCDQMEPRMEETRKQDEKTLYNTRDIAHDGSDNSTRRIVVEHNMLQVETIKHVVHQNCRSSSVPGRVLSRKEQPKIVME